MKVTTKVMFFTGQSTPIINLIAPKISQELVQTMLGASFGCISYLRGIFPDDSFLEERFNEKSDRGSKKAGANANTGQRLMRLRRDGTPEAAALLNYLVGYPSLIVRTRC